MAITPIVDLFAHEAMPNWRSRAFWCDHRLSISMPALITGIVVSLYILLAVKILATAVYFAAPAGGAIADTIRNTALFFDDNVNDHWYNGVKFVVYASCIYIGENIARAALDISIQKPFAPLNASRFMRSGIAAAVLTAFHFAIRVVEKIQGVPATPGGGTILLLGGLTAAIFVSLSLAFHQGAAMQKDQDLTV